MKAKAQCIGVTTPVAVPINKIPNQQDPGHARQVLIFWQNADWFCLVNVHF